ncbi:MAG: ice-binding family protein, partial [Rhodoferax sp.]|nr:ice-binding family protein [Rhodoferax sp.]
MNRFESLFKPLMWLMALLLAGFLAACGGGGSSGAASTAASGLAVAPGAAGAAGGSATDPTVSSSSPADNATNVPTSQNSGTATPVTAFFSQAMNPATINSAPAGTLLTFTLKETSGNNVPGTVAMNAASTAATFTPTASALTPNTSYTATVTTAARNAGGTAMANPVAWTFMTSAVASSGLLPVNLGTAGNFVVLAKSGISTVPGSLLTGDIGVSPIARIAITGFSETMDSSNTFSRSAQVVGKIYAADYTPPTPTMMTTAVADMEIAYADAAGRTLPDFTELGAGEIGGRTLAPGLYKWGTGVSISTDVTLSGSATDVWIFQIAGDVTQASATKVTLAGGALAKNVFWQVAGGTGVTIGTTAHFEGTILAITAINLTTGASANSRLLAQTAVNLQQNAVTQPA